MLTAAKCRFCGCDTTVETEDGVGEFFGFVNRIKMSDASCQPCGELHGAQMRKEDQERKEREQREKELAREEKFVKVVGSKYRGCSLDTFQAITSSQAAALKVAREFAVAPSGFLYLHGKPGVGKTHLSIGIFREHQDHATFWSVPELLLHLRSQIGQGVSEDQAIEPLLRRSILILDDLGAEKITDWVRQAFYVVISRRERDELPTVITSNLSLGEIEVRVGDDRITSRIGGAARIVKIEGKDGRLERRITKT